MESNHITVRPATATDAEMVAWTVLTALDMPADDTGHMMESCADEKSMYSWKNSLIAEVDGKPAGCIVSYRGDDYAALRQYTWGNLWGREYDETIAATPAEAEAGEYYLDSLAVLPAQRGVNIGKDLILAAIERGKEQGYRTFTLLVDINKPRLMEYYRSLGFTPGKEVTFFGHRYHKMALTI